MLTEISISSSVISCCVTFCMFLFPIFIYGMSSFCCPIFSVFYLFELDNFIFHFLSLLCAKTTFVFSLELDQFSSFFLSPNFGSQNKSRTYETVLDLHKLKYQYKLRGNNQSLTFSAWWKREIHEV